MRENRQKVKDILKGKRHIKIMNDIRKKRKRKTLHGDGAFKWYDKIIVYGPVILFVLFCLIPIIAMISSSFSDSKLIKEQGAALWPQGFTTTAYTTAFKFPQEILMSYLISISVTVLGTVVNVLLLLTLGFYLARSTSKLKKYINFFVFFTMMFGPGIVPTYIWYRDYLRIYDTFAVLMLPSLVSVWHLFLLRLFFAQVSESIYESAKMDGASEFLLLFKIVSPMITAGIATVTFYSVLMYWNDSFTALLYTENPNLIPVSLYLTRVTNYIAWLRDVQRGAYPGLFLPPNFQIPENTMVFAVAIITTGPMLFVFTLFQRYFVRGVVAGSVKE